MRDRATRPVVVGLGAYAYHEFTKTGDKGFKEGREYRDANQERIDEAWATANGGDAKKVDEKNEEADQKEQKALKTAAEAAMEGARLPGTVSGGAIGLKPQNAAGSIVKKVINGKAIDTAKKKAEEQAKNTKPSSDPARLPPPNSPPPPCGSRGQELPCH